MSRPDYAEPSQRDTITSVPTETPARSVRSYNARIVNNHHEQLYANEEKALTEWASLARPKRLH